MNHLETSAVLTDLLALRLEGPAAAEAWQHVASCRECQDVVTAMHMVRSAIATGGAEAFSPHPASDDLVRYALIDPELSTPALARIGAHVLGCEECGRAAELTRRAEAATRHEPGRFMLPWSGLHWPRWAPVLVPALGALAVALAFPAWQGAVGYPELARRSAAIEQEAAILKDETRSLRASLAGRASEATSTGPVRLLYLPPATRGESSVARLTLFPGQAFQPVVIQHRPFEGAAPNGRVEIRVIRESNGATTWHEERAVTDLWDAAQSAMVLLLPARDLSPGRYRLEILSAGTLRYATTFDAVAAGR